jgi:DNA-binding beta-propeller fold protein YncE
MSRFPLVLIATFICLQGFAAESYKGPSALCPTKDGKTIYIVNKDSHEIAVFNTADDKVAKSITLGDGFLPAGAVLSADEKILYVVGGGVKGRVLAVEPASGNITKTGTAGHTPAAVAISPDGTKLFVCNQFTNNVSEFSLPDLTPTRVIKVVREPRCAVVTQDGKYVLVANSIPLMPNNYINHDSPLDNPRVDIYVASEVTVINIASGETKPIKLPNGSGALHGMCITPDGRYVYISEVIAKFFIPTTQVEKGWMNTAGIAIIDTTQLDTERGGYIDSVLIDDVDTGAGNPWGITTSADGTKIYVAVAGTSELITVDAVEMHKKLNAGAGQSGSLSYGAGVSGQFSFLVGMKKRITLPGKGARAITVAGGNVYVGMYFSDTLQKLDETALRPSTVALGPTPNWTPVRRGEIHWNDATLCQQQWQSCASCHPDARMDGYNWDLLNDGMGNPKNTKSLLLAHKTPPSMWHGVRDNINHPTDPWDTDKQGLQCIRTGFKWILFREFDEALYRDIDAYLIAEQPVPSPFLVDGKLSAKAERGKKIFDDPKVGCYKCHPAPLFTDKRSHDVKTECYFDLGLKEFDTPTLVECWRTSPYLHDGRYVDMKDVFKIGKHGDVAGDVGGLTDEQIDELVEYVLSL